MKPDKYDFGGYVTKVDKKCTDGAVIKHGAFKANDGKSVPLYWEHGRKIPENLLGNVILEHRDDGVYGYASFNDTKNGLHVKQAVMHGDVKSLSIFANALTRNGPDIYDGDIAEVSIVTKGANAGAYIDDVVLQHADGTLEDVEGEAFIYMDEPVELQHTDDDVEIQHNEGKTIGDILLTMTDDQRAVIPLLLEMALSDDQSQEAEHSDTNTIEHDQKGTVTEVHKNVFDQNNEADTINHNGMSDEDYQKFIKSAIAGKVDSFHNAFLEHADAQYGIVNVEKLFPNAKLVRQTPDRIMREQTWVPGILNGVHTVPTGRIKSMSADLTLNSARAKGYVTTALKTETFIELRDRETYPQTIYVKKKIDKDVKDDIEEWDVVVWMKDEMSIMFNEELARAILFGDGRDSDDPDKISSTKIRPVATDDEFYTHRIDMPPHVVGETEIEELIRFRKYFKGTGRPNMYTSTDWVIDHLLIKDFNGRRIYKDVAELAATIGVNAIIEVDASLMPAGLKCIMVNPADYDLGSPIRGRTDWFDHFDIDFNQWKYLKEGRYCGALTRPKSAVAVWTADGIRVVPEEPVFDPDTGIVTIPTVVGVVYTINEVVVTGAQPAITKGSTIVVACRPDTGNYFPSNLTTRWEFLRPLI